MALPIPPDDGLADDLATFISNSYDYACDYIFHFEPHNCRRAIGIGRLLRGWEGIRRKVDARQTLRIQWLAEHSHELTPIEKMREQFICKPEECFKDDDEECIYEILSKFDTVSPTFLPISFIFAFDELHQAGDELAVRLSRLIGRTEYRVPFTLTVALQKRREAYADYQSRLARYCASDARTRKRPSPSKPSASGWMAIEELFLKSALCYEKVLTLFSGHRPEPSRGRSSGGKRNIPHPANKPRAESPNLGRRSGWLNMEMPESPISLGGPDEDVIVRGKVKPPISPSQYRVVKALIDAFPGRLGLDTLARRSKTDDPIGIIDRLKKDADWDSVLDKAGKSHRGYGLKP